MGSSIRPTLTVLCLLAGVLAAGVFTLSLWKAPKTPSSELLAEAIMGRWVGRFAVEDEGRVHLHYYQLEFLDSGRFMYYRIAPAGLEFNVEMEYELKEPDRVIIQARQRDEWTVTHDDDGLHILSANGLIRDGLYQRRPTIPWPVLCSALTALGLALLFVQVPQPKGSALVEPAQDRSEHNRRHNHLRHSIVIVLGFGLGAWLAIMFWQAPVVRLIRVPWDIVTMILTSLILAIAGAKALMLLRSLNHSDNVLPCWLLTLLVVIMLGGASGSVLMAFPHLVYFVIFGSYPYG